jgi:hypothetical protein
MKIKVNNQYYDFSIKLINFLYIFTYFFYVSRDPFPRVLFFEFTLIIEIISITIFILLYFKIYIIREVLIYLCLFFLLITHFLIIELSIIESPNFFQNLINIFRLSAYIFYAYIFAKYIFCKKYFFKYFLFASTLCLILLLLFSLPGLNYLGMYGYGYYRPALFLSEPSAFAPIISFLLVYSAYKKNIILLILSITSLFVINSGLVVAVSFITLLIYLLQKVNIKYSIFFSVIAVLFFSMIASNYSFHSLDRIVTMFTDFDLNEGQYGQARIATFFNVINFLTEVNALYFGTGFNSAKILHTGTYLYNEFSFTHIILHSFGLLGIGIYFSVLVYTYKKIVKYYFNDSVLFIFFVATSVSALTNSAEGSIMYKLHLIVIFYVLLKRKIKIQA